MNLTEANGSLQVSSSTKALRPIDIVSIARNENLEILTSKHTIIFLLEGNVNFSIPDCYNLKTGKRRFFCIPAGMKFACTAKTDTVIFMVRLPDNISFREYLKLENYEYRNKQTENRNKDMAIRISDINPSLQLYFKGLRRYFDDGIVHDPFLETKTRELLYLLGAYYPAVELMDLFHHILTEDTVFSDLVLKNYHKFKTATDLAKSMHYTLSGFNKKFKSVFGVSAYKWMKAKKMDSIYHELYVGNKSLKQLSYEFGFSSTIRFNDFCKENFGKTPGEIRRPKKGN